ncbi:SIR2 family NAD-dependent protein deacylase [Mycobacterium bourgelatii]|uniref:SIR2 family protein n=1 Tax=Mycobacterium bourgelatii TaxID=1273442 RepID=A0A7I9YSB5_MYCBU|nr:SIR2 family protein [Mycobacterium bourgelatii]MCV6977477.1 SIR2 family protein [Mycobacterium bourgelatii]GFG91393.1 SIR2 family protein [Mycobacterium bourgelatii]
MGHLFVAHGDLTKLACDAVLIPCDDKGWVTPSWRSLLPPELPRDNRTGWLLLPNKPDADGIVRLPPLDKRSVQAFASMEWVATDPADVAERLLRAVSSVSGDLPALDGRAVPLVGIPLAGTGHGGLAHRRGEVIDKLLEKHRVQGSSLKCDVALILYERRDFVAVQARRRPEDWPWNVLREELRDKADHLGRLARTGQLSLFLGSGVSRPVGLPDWNGLLEYLAKATNIDLPSNVTPETAASIIKSTLPAATYHQELKNALDCHRHGIGHALLASLPVTQMVTTNFDPCMELALEGALGPDEFRVLIRQVADSSKPWLLKLNGDIGDPASVVLTTEDFQLHEEENRALHGLVQGLLLTSHLLFVGFSFTDESVLRLAEFVTRVLRAARSASPNSYSNTAIALTPDDLRKISYDDLEILQMSDSATDVREAARLLEIFLDRLCWKAISENDRAAEYLLDDRYLSSLSAEDQQLRDGLLRLVDETSSNVKSNSTGWKRIEAVLRDLGWRPSTSQ